MSARDDNERRYLVDLLDRPRGEVSNGHPTRRVLYFATPEHEIPIAYFITIGFADAPARGERFELALLVGERHLAPSELQTIGHALLTIADQVASAQLTLSPEQLIPTAALEPTFRRRSHSYVTDWESDSPTYLPLDGDEVARLLCLQPIFDEERRWIGTMSQRQVMRAFADAEIMVEDRDRAPLRMVVGPKLVADEIANVQSHDFKKLFDALIAWGIEHEASVGALEPPATVAALAKLEASIGRALPDDLRQALQVSDGGAVLGSFGLIDVARIALRYAQQAVFVDQPSGSESESCKRVKWSNGWIPFAEDGGLNFRCIDLDPGPKGIAGQVIWWDAELATAGATRFDSFGDWLAAAITDCTSGKATVEANGMVELSADMR